MKPCGQERLMVGWLGVCVLLIVPTFAFGNGFDIYEQGAKAVGMGGAFTAQADDPSAIFFNPAGILQMEGTQVSVGITPIMPSVTFKSDGNALMGSTAGQKTDAKDHTWLIPNGYITHKVNERISIGIGSFAHFGLGIEWPKDFEGRFAAGSSKAILKTTSISPVIAIKPVDRLLLGFGPYFQYMSIELHNNAFIGFPTPPLTADRNLAQTADARVEGADWGWGYNLGLLFRIMKNLTFGASYLSEARHKINGNQELTSLSNGTTILKQGASGTITLPATLRLGLAWKRNPWTFEIDGQWTEWSSFRDLRIDFEDGTSVDVPKKWHNSWTYRFGVQYTVNKYLDLRAGFIYDQTPIPRDTLDPLVPSGNVIFYCLGLGTHLGRFTVDAGYNYVQGEQRRWNNPAGDVMVGPFPLTRVTGKFINSSAHLFSVSASYRF